MSKARTLADFISDGSEFADGTISVAEVSGAAPLASPTFTGNVDLGDNVALRLGDSDDLQIYHDGSDSYVEDAGAGSLQLKGANVVIRDSSDTIMFKANDGGSSQLRYGGITRVETTSTGIDITGNATFADNGKAVFGDSDDLQIYHNANNSYVRDVGTGKLHITSDGTGVSIDKGTSELMATFDIDGAVTLYHDNSAKIATSSTGADITGKTTTDELDLNALAATISDTAVDIFVYDTRKDSDGGAWRKRTQHTSWYNETLNTATRGSRKEFPAVAVIVIESLKLTVYDGDDPDLPMWMVINADASIGGGVSASSSGITTTKALFHVTTLNATAGLNGQMIVGTGNWHVFNFNFVDDKISFHAQYGTFGAGQAIYSNPISGRNSSGRFVRVTSVGILTNAVNDVAMTVLPNAPIDAATGLPVPTIAVATDGGISVIRDDGNVYDIAFNSYGFNTVDFQGDEHILAGTRNIGSGGSALYVNVYPIPSADSGSIILDEFIISRSAGSDNIYTGSIRTPFGNTGYDTETDGSTTSFIATDEGLLHYTPSFNDTTVIGGSMGVGITSSFNTGWMHSNIKLATLSDTDDTDVTGSELVTNGTFDTDTSGWTAGSGTTLSLSSNELVIASDTSTYGTATQSITLEANTTYVFTVYIAYSTNVYYTRYRLSGTDFYQTLLNDGVSSLGWHSVTFTTGSTVPNDIELILSARNDVVNQRIDNISIRKAEEDRSVNGNGLQVFGSITKNPVATGADLVAYSGFSTSNYLQQPYNSGLDFGTGNWCYMWWQKMDSVTNGMAVFGRDAIAEGGTSAGRIGCYFNADKLRVDLTDDGASSYTGKLSSQSVIGLTGWNCFVIIRRGSNFEFYINGKFDSSVALGSTGDGSYTNTSATLSIGYDVNVGAALSSGALALFRASATAPSPEQIKKIYEDEKVLFQENAQATLYGSSDAVTALAYDDSTNLLHVGTSAGRSVFQGLRRVDNTTTAVGAAISASNGLVADE